MGCTASRRAAATSTEAEMSQINRTYFGISNTPSTSGALTVSTAVSGPYRTLGAAHDGMSFDVSIVDGSAWEIRTGCVYTHSGTSLSRGALEDSSTGSAINLTSSALVMVTSTAGAINAANTVLTYANRSASYGFFVANNGSDTQTTTDAGWRVMHGGSGGLLKDVQWNVGSVWSADSNGRATLPAGRWLLGGCAVADGLTSTQRLFVAIQKNGEATPSRLLFRTPYPASTVTAGGSGSTLVESNGSDYFCLVTYVDGSGTHVFGSNPGFGYFWGQYLGPTL